jgi:hypothetical protein
MGSDITLAVGDGARRMTYTELAAARGISRASAKRMAQRHHWGRQVGNDGVVRVTVPLSALANTAKTKAVTGDVASDVAPGVTPMTEPLLAEAKGKVITTDTDSLSPTTGATDPMTRTNVAGDVTDDVAPGVTPAVILATEPLARSVEVLGEQLKHEREQANRAERRLDELQVLLAEERRRVDGLYTELADARTAAMISSADAAALRARLEILTARLPWWRRWFR